MSVSCLNYIETLERPHAPFICASAPEDYKDRLTVSRGELVKLISQELSSRVSQLLVCPTVQIFAQERAKIFGEYFVLLKAMSKIVLADTDTMVHQTLVQGSISHYENQVRQKGPAIFGDDVTGEILFSLATMSRAYRLVGQILSSECPEAAAAEDADNAREFGLATAWSSVHIDCIYAILKGNVKTTPIEVLQEILVGCRFAVTAFAYARLGYNARYEVAAPAQEVTQWDAEDRFLAALSTDEATITE